MRPFRDTLGMTAAWALYFDAILFCTPIGWLVLVIVACFWGLTRHV